MGPIIPADCWNSPCELAHPEANGNFRLYVQKCLRVMGMVAAEFHVCPFLPQANTELHTSASVPSTCTSGKLCGPRLLWSDI